MKAIWAQIAMVVGYFAFLFAIGFMVGRFIRHMTELANGTEAKEQIG